MMKHRVTEKTKTIIASATVLLVLILLSGCSSGGQVMDGDDMFKSYTQISQETAKEMMAQDDGHIIVDVRRQDEYDAGHIPGAILIPNESIGTEQPEKLPDLDQIILIYCRSGNRSKQAAQKLFDMGYTNIYEFGGIIDWTGEIVTSGKAVEENSSEQALYSLSRNSGHF
ncbi:MAG: rhodanese-like domain-containing protein [Eubacteriales bacterium]|nr:rhodanese-like domain-containing protein [Eubacteriales bacterium]